MEWINHLFGSGEHLNWVQMSSLAAVSFFFALVLLRIAGMRTFGRKSPFDNVILIILGAVLSRAIVGSSPFIPVMISCFAMVIIHRLLAWVSLYNDFIGGLIKGEHQCLYAEGRKRRDNMRRALISEKDLMEGVRLQINEDSLKNVIEVFIERNGEISVVKKQDGISGDQEKRSG